MTPDLLPADVIGVNVYNQRSGEWERKEGPIFSNVLLVDELNRASPKVQSAFLEVMQEKQVTLEGVTLPVPMPFMVLATQVPFAGTGTYVLTDVQLDRFGYKIGLDYPEDSVELNILGDIDRIESVNVEKIVEPDEIVELGRLLRISLFMIGLSVILWTLCCG
jgi:MoxR-like ATPase